MAYLRSFLVWIILMLAEMIHALFRNALLVPAFGDFKARQVSVFSGALIIFLITFFSVRWIKGQTKKALLLIGLQWVLLTLVFEFSLGIFVFHYDSARILSDYDILHGGMMPFGQFALFFSPLLAEKLHQ